VIEVLYMINLAPVPDGVSTSENRNWIDGRSNRSGGTRCYFDFSSKEEAMKGAERVAENIRIGDE